MEDSHQMSRISAQSNVNAGPLIGPQLNNKVIQKILNRLDIESFLVAGTLNRRWREAVETREAYLYQLNHNTDGHRAFTDAEDDVNERSLADLKRCLRGIAKQQRQRKQYKRQIWNLVAPSTASSTVSPHGETFRVTFSPRGHVALAASASRLFMLNVTGSVPLVMRVLKIRRRPQACVVTDDGMFLAVLTSDWKVHTYHLSSTRITQGRTTYLDGPARTIALSPDRTLLAAAHSDFIELQSIVEDSIHAVRRRLPCQGIVSLSFSTSGLMLLGTTKDHRQHNTTLVSAPMQTGFDPDIDIVEQPRLDQLWTSQLLFPNVFRDCGHAALVPDWYDGEISRVLGYDGPAEAFGLINIEQYQFEGSTFDERPISKGEPQKCPCLPAVDSEGTRVAVARGKELRVHRIPSLDAEQPDEKCQVVYNLQRLENPVSRIQWVTIRPEHLARQKDRLISVFKGRRHVDTHNDGEESLDKVQMMVLDFNLTDDGDDHITTIELDCKPIEVLEEDGDDLEEELAIQGRLATARADGSLVPKGGVRRSVTSGRRHNRQRSGAPRRSSGDLQPSIREDGTVESMEAPYSHSDPRPAPQLARAATVAAAAPRFRPSIEPPRMRIPGSRGEIPDESDADHWVPPPPPYERVPDQSPPSEPAGTDLITNGNNHASSNEGLLEGFSAPLRTHRDAAPVGSEWPLRGVSTTEPQQRLQAGATSPPEQSSFAIVSPLPEEGLKQEQPGQPKDEDPPITTRSISQRSIADQSRDGRGKPEIQRLNSALSRSAIARDHANHVESPILLHGTSVGDAEVSAASEPKEVKRKLSKIRSRQSDHSEPKPVAERPISPAMELEDSKKMKRRSLLSFRGGSSGTADDEPGSPESPENHRGRKRGGSRSGSSLKSSDTASIPLPISTAVEEYPSLPALPSDAQMASLNRRGDSVPSQLARSRSSSAPRVAAGAHRGSWNNSSNEFLPQPHFRQSSYGSFGSPYGGSTSGNSPVGTPRSTTPLGMHANGSTSSFKQAYTQRLGTIEDDDPASEEPVTYQTPPSPGQSYRKRMSGGYTSRRTRLSTVIGNDPTDPASVDMADEPLPDSVRPSEDGQGFNDQAVVAESPYAHDLPPTKVLRESGSRGSFRAAIQTLRERASATRLREAIPGSSGSPSRGVEPRGAETKGDDVAESEQGRGRGAKARLAEVVSAESGRRRAKKCSVM